jgi:hypothetical protein
MLCAHRCPEVHACAALPEDVPAWYSAGVSSLNTWVGAAGRSADVIPWPLKPHSGHAVDIKQTTDEQQCQMVSRLRDGVGPRGRAPCRFSCQSVVHAKTTGQLQTA